MNVSTKNLPRQAQTHQSLRRRTIEADPRAMTEIDTTVFWELSTDLLCIADASGRLIKVNHAWERLGYATEDLLTTPLDAILHPEDREATATMTTTAQLEATVAGAPHRIAPFQNRVRRADGIYRWMEWSAYTDGQLWYSAARDITERKTKEIEVERERAAATWSGKILDALANDRFILHAQPIVEIASRKVVQHELLIRMRDEAGALVPPGLFLPTAEQYGLIVDIDRWVIREGARLAAAGHPVEINLSARSLGDLTLICHVQRALEAHGSDPGLIVFEITETGLLADEPSATAFVERVKALGCRVALDDFGTGYGGFTYLKRLPVDYLKIDIEFVADLPRNEASQHVVSAVVNLAHGFGQKTVAEGVEDEQTLALLHELGVDYGQGYGLGRPAPVETALATPATRLAAPRSIARS